MPEPIDLMPLTAIRWFMCRMEELAIQAYCGKPSDYDKITETLARACKALEGYGRVPPGAEDSCPWRRCKDGSCRPACDV